MTSTPSVPLNLHPCLPYTLSAAESYLELGVILEPPSWTSTSRSWVVISDLSLLWPHLLDLCWSVSSLVEWHLHEDGDVSSVSCSPCAWKKLQTPGGEVTSVPWPCTPRQAFVNFWVSG